MSEDTRAAWQMTVEEYIGPCSVGGPINMILPRAQLDASANNRTYANVVSCPEASGYSFHFNNLNSFKIVHEDTGQVAGIYAGMMVYVDPEHRGKGLMAAMYAVLEDAGIRNDHRNLTPGSLSALRGAHRILVQRALKAGEKVPLAVLSQYRRCEDGSLALRNRYGREECNAYRDHVLRRNNAATILDKAARQDVSFVMRDVSSETKDAAGVSAYPDRIRMRRAAGLRLADRLARETGGVIRMAVGSYRDGEENRYCDTAFSCVVEGTAIDGLGAVPEGDWESKILSFGVMREEIYFGFMGSEKVDVEMRDFGSARDCVAWMRQNRIRFSPDPVSLYAMLRGDGRDKAVEEHAIEAASGYARGLAAKPDETPPLGP